MEKCVLFEMFYIEESVKVSQNLLNKVFLGFLIYFKTVEE